MKKLIILSIAVLIFISATYTSMQAADFISKPATCESCHSSVHQENILYNRHSAIAVNCIDCHSDGGVKGYVEARKDVVKAIILGESGQLLDHFFKNVTYNINFNNLHANCIKCHTQVNSQHYNHSGIQECIPCHSINESSPQTPTTGLWEKMGTGGHRNITCNDCHTASIQIPACTNCHKPHKENATWNNSVCLACHESPHVPVRNGSLSIESSKEDCATCHNSVYETLSFYNSKHNTFSSCAYCHPAHTEKKKCFDCHVGEHTSHPFAQGNCGSCHGKVTCQDCHEYPHAPLRDLPKITTIEQFNDYAATRKGH
jgi:hypothetical protein